MLNDLVQITTLHSLIQILLRIFIWNILHFLCTKTKVWFSEVKQHNWSVLKCLTLYEFIPLTTVSLLQNFIWYALKFSINPLCKHRSVKFLKLQSFQFYSWFSSYIFSLSAQSRSWRNIIVMSPICYTKSKLTTSVSIFIKSDQSLSIHSILIDLPSIVKASIHLCQLFQSFCW